MPNICRGEPCVAVLRYSSPACGGGQGGGCGGYVRWRGGASGTIPPPTSPRNRGRGAIMIGVVLSLVVPARRLFRRSYGHVGTPGIAVASAGYGLVIGGTTGTGVILLSILLAGGLHGTAVIATDAAVSLVIG